MVHYGIIIMIDWGVLEFVRLYCGVLWFTMIDWLLQWIIMLYQDLLGFVRFYYVFFDLSGLIGIC